MAHYLERSERITMQSRFQTLQNTSEAEKLGICLQKPHASQYSSLAARIRSYSHWTKSNPRPVDLADAGFYFTGMIFFSKYMGSQFNNLLVDFTSMKYFKGSENKNFFLFVYWD